MRRADRFGKNYLNQSARLVGDSAPLVDERASIRAAARLLSSASNFNYTATERGERFDARPAYQDNGFHRPMVRIYQSAVRGCA